MAKYKVEYADTFDKAMKKLDRRDQRFIIHWIDQHLNNVDFPTSPGKSLKGILKLLDIVYFDGSLEKGNENRIIFEFSKSRTIAIEVRLMEKKIRFWGWIGDYQEGDYFWKYVFKNYPKLGHKILDLLIAEYFLPTDVISCEVVSSVNTDLLYHWCEGTKR